jgi:uncharacterized protein (TIGR02588 family)
MARPQTQTKSRKSDTPMLEWLVGSIGVGLLVACVCFLIYEGVSTSEQPGAVTASVKEIIKTDAAHLVTFDLQNTGTQTLSNVHVTARLAADGREIERAQTVIDYLPGRSHQEGGFYFEHDPRAFELEIRPEGYQTP